MPYTAPKHHTTAELVRDYLLDLIADIHAAERDGQTDYAARVRAELAALWPVRHRLIIDCYGVPRQALPNNDEGGVHLRRP